MDDQELTPGQAEAVRLQYMDAPSDQLRAMMRAFVEQRDRLTRGQAGEVGWWTPGRLNHAAVIASQILRERDLMALRMSDAVVEASGVQAVGPPSGLARMVWTTPDRGHHRGAIGSASAAATLGERIAEPRRPPRVRPGLQVRYTPPCWHSSPTASAKRTGVAPTWTGVDAPPDLDVDASV